MIATVKNFERFIYPNLICNQNQHFRKLRIILFDEKSHLKDFIVTKGNYERYH